MAYFVLVHGACHGAWCWYKLVALLRSMNHRVTALDMASCGANPRRADDIRLIPDYYQPLMELMASIPAEERVILVGHSAGGLEVSLAMEKFPDKISVAVFVTAFMPGPSLTFLSLNQEYVRRLDTQMDNEYKFHGLEHHSPPISFRFGNEFLASKLYQLCPQEDYILATMLVRPIPVFSEEDMLSETVVSEQRYGSVRRVYIVGDEDKVIKEDFQMWMIEKNPPTEVKKITGSDHMTMLSKPHELCTCLQEVVQSYF